MKNFFIAVLSASVLIGCGGAEQAGPEAVEDCEGRGFYDLGFASQEACIQVLIATKGPITPEARAHCAWGGAGDHGFDSLEECESAVDAKHGPPDQVVSRFEARARVVEYCRKNHRDRDAAAECRESLYSTLEDQCGSYGVMGSNIPAGATREEKREQLVCRNRVAAELAEPGT